MMDADVVSIRDAMNVDHLLSNQLVLVGKKFELGSSQCATEKLVRHCPEESVWSERLIWSLNFMIPVLVWLT